MRFDNYFDGKIPFRSIGQDDYYLFEFKDENRQHENFKVPYSDLFKLDLSTLNEVQQDAFIQFYEQFKAFWPPQEIDKWEIVGSDESYHTEQSIAAAKQKITQILQPIASRINNGGNPLVFYVREDMPSYLSLEKLSEPLQRDAMEALNQYMTAPYCF